MEDDFAESNASQIRVQFFTQQKENVVTDTPIAVPSHVRRSHLSQMINHLLGSTTPKPFDFLINGEFLRVSLQKFVQLKAISTEEILAIEYIEAMVPPEQAQTAQHDDWISSIAGHRSGAYVLTGCFNKQVYIWNNAAELQATLSGHEGVIRSVAWGHRKDNDAPKSLTVYSAGHDETLRKWRFNPETNDTECTFIYRGHVSSVSSVAVQPGGYMICSGSWDRTIRVWATSPAEDDEYDVAADPAKRRKIDTEQQGPLVKRALGTFHGSTAAVKSVIWPTDTTIYSAGEDHAVRIWDAETGQNKQVMAGSKAISDIAASSENSLIAAGEIDAAVRIYDSRSDQVVRVSLTSHNLPVNSVAWSPINAHQLVSGSLDQENNLKVWDIRSTKIPMFSVQAHKDKVFAVDWATADVILSGGAESKLSYHGLKSNSTN